MIRDDAYPIYVTAEEGGEVLPFRKWQDRPPRNPAAVHAIWFSDGSIFDTVSGWRKDSPYRKPIVRVKMARA